MGVDGPKKRSSTRLLSSSQPMDATASNVSARYQGSTSIRYSACSALGVTCRQLGKRPSTLRTDSTDSALWPSVAPSVVTCSPWTTASVRHSGLTDLPRLLAEIFAALLIAAFHCLPSMTVLLWPLG